MAAANSGSSANSSQIPFAQVQLFIEYNSADADAGIQAFLDAEAWKKVNIDSPDGRSIFEVTAQRSLRQIGLTEVRIESDEPSLQEILAAFPPGQYEFEGETTEGEELEGTALLSHNIPGAPTILSPLGGLVDPNNTVIQWRHAGGVASFQVSISRGWRNGAWDEIEDGLVWSLPHGPGHLRLPAAETTRDRCW